MAIRADAVSLRDGAGADVPALVPLYLQLVAATGGLLTRDAAAAKLRALVSAGHRVALAEHGGRAVGYALWRDTGRDVRIRHFVVHRDLRGRGLGAALFRRLAGELLPRDRPLRLDAHTEAARRFWQAHGFVEHADALERPAPAAPQEELS